MSEPAGPPAAGFPLPERTPLLGMRDYAEAVDAVIERAMGRVRIFDRALGREFNTPERTAKLRRFLLASPANRVLIAVHEVGNAHRDCPRLVELLRRFGHGVFVHRTQTPARGVYDPFCVVDGSHYARRFHFDTPRGVLALNDAEASTELVRRFDEIWECSRSGVSGTTLGL